MCRDHQRRWPLKHGDRNLKSHLEHLRLYWWKRDPHPSCTTACRKYKTYTRLYKKQKLELMLQRERARITIWWRWLCHKLINTQNMWQARLELADNAVHTATRYYAVIFSMFSFCEIGISRQALSSGLSFKITVRCRKVISSGDLTEQASPLQRNKELLI